MNIDFKLREYRKNAKILMNGKIDKAVKELKNHQFESYKKKLDTIRARKAEIKENYKKNEEEYLSKGIRPKQPKMPLTPAQIQKQYRDRLKAEKMSEKAITEALESKYEVVSDLALLDRAVRNAKLALNTLKKQDKLSNTSSVTLIEIARAIELRIKKNLRKEPKVNIRGSLS